MEVPVRHDMSTHVFLAGLGHQVCPPALLFRLGSRKVRRYKNTWIRNSSDAMAQQEWKVVRRRRSSEGCSTSPIFPLSTLFQTCPPPPWQERPPRARTSPPGGWSSPVRRTCRQVCLFDASRFGNRLRSQILQLPILPFWHFCVAMCTFKTLDKCAVSPYSSLL